MRKIKRCYNLRKRRVFFNPSHSDLEMAIAEYLKQGGVISEIVPSESSFDCFIREKGDLKEVDDFLLGR